MEFELCDHDPQPTETVLWKDDLDRWIVNIECANCGAEGRVVIQDAQPYWDAETLPEWRQILSNLENKDQENSQGVEER